MTSMSQKRALVLNIPGDGDNQADLDRLCAALEPEFGPVRVDYTFVRRELPKLRPAEYHVTATLTGEPDGWRLLRLQPGDTAARHFGFACDLGSTTIAVSLVDLNANAVVNTMTEVNPQVERGTDILTRIFYTREPGLQEARREEMQRRAVSCIDGMMARLAREAQVDLEDCPVLAVAGNTTMIHFLLAADAFCVFSAPFAPAFNRVPMMDASALGFQYPGRIYCFPDAANYMGGDILSGLWATDLTESDALSLFVDIGTNGEMAVGCREFLIAGAGAAGPALEGGISRDGMRAAPGAVDTVRIRDGRVLFTTIGGEPARGICGSGIVDLLAQMRASGWMNALGRLDPAASERIIRVPAEDGERTELAAVYATAEESAAGRPLIFTQADIQKFTDTKAAAHTMVACLLQAAGIEAEQLDRVFLAGAFGEHLDLESAIAIGLYPDLPRERFVAVGNASLLGAQRLLMDRSGLERVEKILKDLYYLEFAMQPNFLDLMGAARFY